MGGESTHGQALNEGCTAGIGQRAGGVKGDVARAGHVVTPEAGPAVTAGSDERDDHRVADGEIDQLVVRLRLDPDFENAPGGLVAQHEWEVGGPCAVEVAQVGVADGAGLDFHPDLAGTWGGQMDVLDFGRDADASAHRRTDGHPPAR